MSEPPVLVSADTIAARFNVTSACVRKWATKGKMAGAYKLNGVWRFDLSKVDRWWRASEREPIVWDSIKGGRSGGSASNGKARRSGDRLEQLIGLKR
jgi:hypothetical protein